MAERIYPSSKPATNGSTAPTFPATKGQLYNASRPMYRPQPPTKRRSGRGLCCSCCLWVGVLLVILVLLAAIAACVFYLVYRPHRPSFSLSSVRLASFNLTSSSLLTSRLDISVTARNPNKKLVYVYDDIAITTTTTTGGGATIGTGTVPGFVHEAGNVTVVRVKVAGEKESVGRTVAAELKKKEEIPVEIKLETKAGVKVGGLKTKKIGVKVACDGATVAAPSKGKAAGGGGAVSCKVKLRIKIWKWNL